MEKGKTIDFAVFLREIFLPKVRLETHFMLLDGDEDE